MEFALLNYSWKVFGVFFDQHTEKAKKKLNPKQQHQQQQNARNLSSEITGLSIMLSGHSNHDFELFLELSPAILS